MQLQGAFTEAGHLCLVLQRLQGSLLDCIASSAELPRSHHTSMLRSIASQLLASPLLGAKSVYDSTSTEPSTH